MKLLDIKVDRSAGLVSVVLSVQDLDPDFPATIDVVITRAAVQSRMFFYNCTAREAVLICVRECYFTRHGLAPQSSALQDQWGGMDSRVDAITVDAATEAKRRVIIPDGMTSMQGLDTHPAAETRK